MTADQKDRLEGELMATQAAVRALIASSPDRNAMALAVQHEIEHIIAIALPENLSDAFLDGLKRGKQCVLPNESTRAADEFDRDRG